ncbi:hypothetical protein LKF67_2485 [Lactococcus lactis subsp. lactis]|uniref:hypothetical protein n=1 Tax=Lactococcus lactis TaxID=1358 RepID=UPI00071CBE47|nr:hypothetical protein [Lactococcus lactis]KST87971.1 hypothetical protein LKF67_2485 [Lactococcus lactis subsp. lactis]
MLLVKLPKRFYDEHLPNDDLFNGHQGDSVLGIVVNDGILTTFSPLLNIAELTYDITATEGYVNLSYEDDEQPDNLIALDKTIILSSEEFSQYIETSAVIPPDEYRVLKHKELEFQEQLRDYIVDYELHPTDPKYRHSSFKFFHQQLEISDTTLVKDDEFMSAEAPYVQPFYNVDTQEEYDEMSQAVDVSRIDNDDRKKYGKEKEHSLDFGM